MSKLRRVFKRYERIFILGLIVFLLVIFTVTDVITGMARGGQEGTGRDEVVGSFEILPEERREVTAEEFDRARRRLEVIAMFAGRRRVSNAEVWQQLVYLAAARREGIRISDARLVEELRQIGFVHGIDILAKDKGPYHRFVGSQFGVSVPEFEEAVRDAILVRTLQDLYRQSFEVAPPQSREELAKQFADQLRENVLVTWAALDAAPFRDAARAELEAESDAAAVLKEFYETDAAVKTTVVDFQKARSYAFEILYAVHKRIDEEGYKRIAEMFSRAYPHLNLADLERPITEEEERSYFAICADRLVEEAGSSWEQLKSLVDPPAEGENENPPAEGEEQEQPAEGEEPEQPAEGEEQEQPAEGEEQEQPADADKEEQEEAERIKEEARDMAFRLVRERIQRELRLRGMFGFLNAEARKHPEKSLSEIVDRLVAHDSPENPVLSREPGKGMLVYREFREPITGEEIGALEDDGAKFDFHVRTRINNADPDNLPYLAKDSEMLTALGHGRMIFRVTRIELQRRMRFDELDEDAKETLRDKYYLPAQARERARAALEDLRKVAVEEKIEHDAFVERARKLGARVVERQWVETGYDFVQEPDAKEYWPDAYEVMRDRYFLRRPLAGPLVQDRREKKLELPAYFEVFVDPRRGGSGPGVAYLPLVLERDPPTAKNMPAVDAIQFAQREREARREELARRMTDARNFVTRFRMEFFGGMKNAMERELKEAAQ